MDISAFAMGVSLTCAIVFAFAGQAWWTFINMSLFAMNMFFMLKGVT